MKKYYTLLFSSLILTLAIDVSIANGETVIYDPLNPSNRIEPTEPDFKTESTTYSTDQVESTETTSSAEATKVSESSVSSVGVNSQENSSEIPEKESSTYQKQTETKKSTQKISTSSKKEEPPKKSFEYTRHHSNGHTSRMSIEKVFLTSKITVDKTLIHPDDTGGGSNSEKMLRITEMSYLLSGVAIYGKKLGGGVEHNVQNIF